MQQANPEPICESLTGLSKLWVRPAFKAASTELSVLPTPHLVNEGGESVVECLDLLLLLLAHLLDIGVNLQVQGCQEALVDGDLLNAPRAEHPTTSYASVAVSRVKVVGPGSSMGELLRRAEVVEAGASKATCPL